MGEEYRQDIEGYRGRKKCGAIDSYDGHSPLAMLIPFSSKDERGAAVWKGGSFKPLFVARLSYETADKDFWREFGPFGLSSASASSLIPVLCRVA